MELDKESASAWMYMQVCVKLATFADALDCESVWEDLIQVGSDAEGAKDGVFLMLLSSTSGTPASHDGA